MSLIHVKSEDYNDNDNDLHEALMNLSIKRQDTYSSLSE